MEDVFFEKEIVDHVGETTIFSPDCLKPDNLFFLDSKSRLIPCCYIRSDQNQGKQRTIINDVELEQLRLDTYTIEEVFESDTNKQLYKNIIEQEKIGTPCFTCVKATPHLRKVLYDRDETRSKVNDETDGINERFKLRIPGNAKLSE